MRRDQIADRWVLWRAFSNHRLCACWSGRKQAAPKSRSPASSRHEHSDRQSKSIAKPSSASGDSSTKPSPTAEYEPILSGEIDSGRILVIPVLLEACEIPLILRSKRYCDLSDGAYDLRELAAQITAEHEERGAVLPSGRQLSTGSPTEKLWSALEILDADSLAGEALNTANAHAAIDLLEEVTRLIEHFEAQYDELATVLTEAAYESSIYGSAHRVPRSRLLQVNRKLITVSNEMRSIARSIARRFSLTPRTKDIIDAITKTCLQIAVIEDFLVIQGVANSDGVKFSLDEQEKMLSGRFIAGKNLESWNWSDDKGGLGLVERYHEVLIKLNDYKIALKEAVLDIELG